MIDENSSALPLRKITSIDGGLLNAYGKSTILNRVITNITGKINITSPNMSKVLQLGIRVWSYEETALNSDIVLMVAINQITTEMQDTALGTTGVIPSSSTNESFISIIPPNNDLILIPKHYEETIGIVSIMSGYSGSTGGVQQALNCQLYMMEV